MAKALKIPADSWDWKDIEVVEWEMPNEHESYVNLLEVVHAAIPNEWLDHFTTDIDVDGENHRLFVWTADDRNSEPFNKLASFLYGYGIYGPVVITEVIGPDTVGLSWDSINYLVAAHEWATEVFYPVEY